MQQVVAIISFKTRAFLLAGVNFIYLFDWTTDTTSKQYIEFHIEISPNKTQIYSLRTQ